MSIEKGTANGSPERFAVIKAHSRPELLLGPMAVTELLHEECTDVSIALITIDGSNPRKINHSSDSIYFVVSGKGEFVFDEPLSVSTGDLIRIRRGTPYSDSGKMTLLAINSPRFDREQEELI